MIVEQKENELSQMRKEFMGRDNDNFRLQEDLAMKNDEIASLKGIINRL